MAEILDLELLRTFLEVTESGSFTRAGQRLNRVQSAVSMQIRRLESIIGRSLFRRKGRTVELTDAGAQLVGYARRMLSLSEEAMAAVGEREDIGPVRLGVSDVASYVLPDVLSRFGQHYPDVELEIHCDRSWTLLDLLDKGDLDLAMVTQHPGRPSGLLVREEPLVWGTARDSRVHEMDPLPLALFAEGCRYRIAALEALDNWNRRWRVTYNSINLSGLGAAVSAGLAVTALPLSSVGDDMRILEADDGFPPLPAMRVTLHHTSAVRKSAMAAKLVGEFVRGPEIRVA
ncbi:MAG: LysR family transcriptional regulator [Gammaproteobacteria bacterium]|nr:LysR family transcriptional regulator [Gammaproteobacteria bacterium]